MVNLNLFQEKIETFHPKSLDYIRYWKEQKRRIIEGYWIGGKFCPPSLYFYLNFGTIWAKKTKHSKSQIKSRPFNYDYLWDRFNYPWLQARGISGFEKVGNLTKEEIENLLYHNSPKGDLGKPLYQNDPKNMILMTSRGTGKTSWGANECAREFLTDAAREYNPSDETTKADIIIGAYDSKLAAIPIKALELALSEVPGAQTINGKYYPSPLSKIVKGSFAPSKDIEHIYKKKIDGKWVDAGSRSIIKNRTYGDNPFASQGGRYTTKLAEEIGMWDNLLACHHADENQTIGNTKLGSTLYIGTGGDMRGGGTIAAYRMFYDPEAYNCVYINDDWENKGKIGIFVSAIESKGDYKDENFITNHAVGKEVELQIRETKKKAKDPGVYDEYITYNPLVPSEIFLQRNSNIFPTVDLAKRLSDLEINPKIGKNAEYIGDIIFDEVKQSYTWSNNRNNQPIYDYPLPKKEYKAGSVVIYEHPWENEFGYVDSGRYISGLDPYDHDTAETSDSLGSLLVYDRLHGKIVCEYTARPETANEFYEVCKRILKYYNATCLYENEKKGFYDFLDRTNETYLLIDQPRILKDMVPNSKVQRGKGMHMVDKFKNFGIIMINNWLRASAGIPDKPEITNASRIRCIPLLKELIMYNEEMNFDRVLAMITLMFHLEELRKYEYVQKENQEHNILDSDFFNKPLFAR